MFFLLNMAVFDWSNFWCNLQPAKYGSNYLLTCSKMWSFLLIHCHFYSFFNRKVLGFIHHCPLTILPCRSSHTVLINHCAPEWDVMQWLQLTSVRAQDTTTVSPSLLLKHLLRSFRLGPSPTQGLRVAWGFAQGNLKEIYQTRLVGPESSLQVLLSCDC